MPAFFVQLRVVEGELSKAKGRLNAKSKLLLIAAEIKSVHENIATARALKELARKSEIEAELERKQERLRSLVSVQEEAKRVWTFQYFRFCIDDSSLHQPQNVSWLHSKWLS